MKIFLAICSLILLPLFSYADCSSNNLNLPPVTRCKNGEAIIVSENLPDGLTKRCGEGPPQWRILKTCQDGKAVSTSIEEFVSFAQANQNNLGFLQAMKGIKVIANPTAADLDKYIASLNKDLKKSTDYQTVNLNDDGEVKEFASLKVIQDMWTKWRNDVAVPVGTSLNYQSLKELSARNNSKIEELKNYSCGSEPAKKRYESIEVPVIRFADNVEQIVLPVEVSETDNGIILQAVTGRLNNSGLFSQTAKVQKAKVDLKSIVIKNGKPFWDGEYEIVSVRKVSLKAASQSIYHSTDICRVQGLLRTVALPADASSSKSPGSRNGNAEKAAESN